MVQGTTYWTDLFVRHFLFQTDRSTDADDLLFFIRKKQLKGSRYIPKYQVGVVLTIILFHEYEKTKTHFHSCLWTFEINLLNIGMYEKTTDTLNYPISLLRECIFCHFGVVLGNAHPLCIDKHMPSFTSWTFSKLHPYHFPLQCHPSLSYQKH